MSKLFMFEPQRKVEFHYPRVTTVGRPPIFKLRKAEVVSVRDLLREPLEVNDYFRKPLIWRSRYLITAIDQDCGTYRNFYIGSMKSMWVDAQLRVGLYAPFSNKPEVILTRGFSPTPRDRFRLAKVVAELSKENYGALQLKIFCDDLRVIR